MLEQAHCPKPVSVLVKLASRAAAYTKTMQSHVGNSHSNLAA